jgi:hypothetical protein
MKSKRKSKRKTRRKSRIRIISKVYDDGEIMNLNANHNGEPFFRKMFFYSDPPTPQQQQIVFAENEIVKNTHGKSASKYSAIFQCERRIC